MRMEKLYFNPELFRLHWLGVTGQYIPSNDSREEILIEYKGDPVLPVSPVRHAIVVLFNGNVFIPFEIIVYSNYLTCRFQTREIVCKRMKTMNFGHRRNGKVLSQVLTFKNFHPQDLAVTVDHLVLDARKHGMKASFLFDDPFPYYANWLVPSASPDLPRITLRSGHIINLTITLELVGEPSAGTLHMNIGTQLEMTLMEIRYNFEEGELEFRPVLYHVNQSDMPYEGILRFASTYRENYTIKEIISSTKALGFYYNESQSYHSGEELEIRFRYDGSQEENLTDVCCGEQFLRHHYLTDLMRI